MGRKIGFPTANLCVNDPEKLVPADGVYAVNVFLGEAKHTGMLSIGYRPTLNNGLDRSIEVHISILMLIFMISPCGYLSSAVPGLN